MTAEVICGATAHACVCSLPPGHPADEPHTCGNDGAQWLGEWDTDTFEAVRLPDPQWVKP